MTFDEIVTLIFGAEGGYDTTFTDPGNWTAGAVGKGELKGTKFGISAAAYPTLDIQGLTIDQAVAIYRSDYWNKIGGDQLPWQLGLLAFDSAVNQGVGAAARLLQATAGVAQDGVVGPETIAALTAQSKDLAGVLVEFGARRALRYAQTGSEELSVFGLGWMRRLMSMQRAALTA